MTEAKLDYTGIETDRWSKGIDHDPRSEAIARLLGQINFDVQADSLCLKFGGDGDNGEELLFALDIYFELQDKGRV